MSITARIAMTRSPTGALEFTQRGLAILAATIGLVSVVFSAGVAWAATQFAIDKKVDRGEWMASRDSLKGDLQAVLRGQASLAAKLDSAGSTLNLIRCEVIRSSSRLTGCGR